MKSLSVLLALTILSALSVLSVIDSAFDPYATLGVKQSASVPEIKRAYKSLARLLHPDKNKESDAENKFIALNKAYDLLMDPERRKQYDRHGITEDTPNFRQRPDYTDFKRFDFDSFDTFFTTSSGGQQHYQFNFNQGTLFRKQSITQRAYENNVIASSFTKPYLILFYGDLCFQCFHIEPVWQKIVSDLEPIGVIFATIHAQHENALTRKIGVQTLPYIMSVVEGEVRKYKDEQINLPKMVEFIRRSLPSGLVTEADDDNYLEFLNGWQDNRVRALFVNDEHIIKLRYVLAAYMFRERIAFAHVNAGSDRSKHILNRYRIDHKMNSLLVFNEDNTRTTATLSMSELKPQFIKDVLEANKFLLLPRLASQEMFDQLCPTETFLPSRRLCVVLITKDIAEHEVSREHMREFIRQSNYPKEKYRFMFVFQEKQPEFVNSLSVGLGAQQISTLHVVVLWRRQHDHVLYEWLSNRWDVANSDQLNETKQNLSNLLAKLAQNTDTFTHDAKVNALIDESMHGIIGKMVKKLLIITDNLSDNITRKELLPAISIVFSIGFIVLIGYIMAYLVRVEEETIKEKYRKLGKQMPGVSKPKNDCKLNIHELRGETYNGLVRLLKPGCRTIVLLVDNNSKPKLLPQFYRAVFPYRRNKTLMFAFILVEKNLDWYKKILIQTLGEQKELQINPKNCIGTVLSLNGFRKYFCVYHAKHPEIRPFSQPSQPKRRKQPQEGTSAAFIGFDDEESNDSNSDIESGILIHRKSTSAGIEDEIIFEEHLLDGLSSWLDRLFEGTTHRYHIQYWPEHMK